MSYIIVIESQDGRRAEIMSGVKTFWTVNIDDFLLHFHKTKVRFAVGIVFFLQLRHCLVSGGSPLIPVLDILSVQCAVVAASFSFLSGTKRQKFIFWNQKQK